MTLEADMRVRLGRIEVDVSLRVSPGETVVVLGPNGAGKTTLLRALAGLVPLEEGRISLYGMQLDDVRTNMRVPVEHRSVGLVFHDYVLFPHMSVLDNVAFGLRAHGKSRTSARREAAEWLARMDLSEYRSAKPPALSSGQAQRVALARALAIRPRLLLLDEPFAALDAGARLDLRRSLSSDLAAFDGVRVVVTHDPLEAIALGDRLIVLEDGRVVQSGAPMELQTRPRSSYVASLVGINLFRGRADANRIRLPSGAELVAAEGCAGDVFAAVHPRAVALYRDRPRGTPRNVWEGSIGGVYHEGARVRVQISSSVPIIAEVTPEAMAEMKLHEGGRVWVGVKASEIAVYPA